MEQNAQINTFEGGMDLDTDLSKIQSNKYRWASNVRLITDSEGTSGVLQNIEDIKQYEGGLDPSEKILGTSVTNYYEKELKKVIEVGVVFTTKVYSENRINNLWIVYNFESSKPTWKRIVSAELDITKNVVMVSNFETNNVNNIYITDDESQIKVINIAKDYNTTEENPIRQKEYFDILPLAQLPALKIVGFVDGRLPYGSVQYCYQLFNLHGNETTTSTLSNLIPIFDDNSNSSKTINGGISGNLSTKGVNLSVTLNDNKFQKLRLYRISYTKDTLTPEIAIINEFSLNDNGTTQTINCIDQGNDAISDITLNEFNDIIKYDFKATTIAKMSNILFASNIKESTWDIDYDARAYRCNKNGDIILQSSNGDDYVGTLEDILSSSTDTIIPLDHDCINPMNDEIVYPAANDEEYAYGYDYFSNEIRGGRGLNIAYRFVTTDLIESDKQTVNVSGVPYMTPNIDISVNKQGNIHMLLYSPETKQALYTDQLDSEQRIRNYSDPYFCSNYLGYQRDETYRFGIIFYNNKNVASPVHWIGDIRFPSADIEGYAPFTYNESVYVGPTTIQKYELVSHPLGIQFEVNNLPDEVYSYEIVRCDRRNSDRTVVTQGILNRTAYFTGWTDESLSLGTTDRRPTIIPTFFKNPSYTKGALQRNDGNFVVNEETIVNGVIVEQNKFEQDGVFDFVSSDICFNTNQIVYKDMKIVPLYCGISPVYDLITKFGVPFTSINGTVTAHYNSSASDDEWIYYMNPFGCMHNVLYGSAVVVDGSYEDYISGGVCKYYKFLDRLYAGSTNRKAYSIDDAIKPKLISPYIQDIKDTKANAEYLGKYNYVNLCVGSKDTYGVHGASNALYSPDLHKELYTIENIPEYDQNLKWTAILFANIKKKVVQYNGNSYVNRINNVYQSIGSYNAKGNNTSICFGGDTYLNVLDYAHTLLFTRTDYTKDNSSKRYIGCYLPLESTVNTYLRTDPHFSQTATLKKVDENEFIADANPYFLSEPGTLSTEYTQKYPMYTYNAAYSAKNNSKSFVPKGLYFEDNLESSTRIVCSEIKTNNEITDSWTKFKFANFLDVDSQYGQITNLKVFKDKLYYFQDSAVGIASVNDRSLIQDNNVGQLVLGTGGILSRFDYLITLNGDSIVNDKSITNSETNLYWYDFDKNVLCTLGNGFQELSKVKGVQTYLNRLPDNARKNPVSFFDKKYNEVWFKVYDRALIFNEQIQQFTSFYTHNPNWFFPFRTKLVTIKDNNCYYLHNMYNVTSNISEDKISYVRFVVNQNVADTKTFDNQMFYADLDYISYDANKPIIKEVKFETDKYYTEPINQNSIDFREDTYRLPIGRAYSDNASQQELTDMSYASRMRGKYLICNYTFDCNENKSFKLPYLKTTYRYSTI